MNDVSKDSRKVLKVLLKQYKKRLKQGQPLDQAAYFSDSNEIHDSWFSDWICGDVEYACFELRRNGYLKFKIYDNIPMIIYLTDKAVTASENAYLTALKMFVRPLWEILKTIISVLKL